MPRKIRVFTEEEAVAEIRDENWRRDKLCGICCSERNGRGIDSGSEAVDAFVAKKASQQAKLPRGESVCKGCPFTQANPGRPGIGHEKGVNFGRGHGASVSN